MTETARPSSPRPRFTLSGRLKSFVYAGRGLSWMVRREHNARLHVAASLAVVAAGLALRLSLADWRWILSAIAMVWAAEAFNTAIEELCDHLNPEFDMAIGRVKDLAAGAVLIASMAAAMIGLLTLGPPLLALLVLAGWP